MGLPRILVIDDEQLLGQTIQLGLEDSMDVNLELLGQTGLDRILGDESFAAILCDLSLPDISGVEIYGRVKTERPDLTDRFVIMTGGAVSDESRDFLDNFDGPLLNKPFTLSQVEALIAGIVGE